MHHEYIAKQYENREYLISMNRLYFMNDSNLEATKCKYQSSVVKIDSIGYKGMENDECQKESSRYIRWLYLNKKETAKG